MIRSRTVGGNKRWSRDRVVFAVGGQTNVSGPRSDRPAKRLDSKRQRFVEPRGFGFLFRFQTSIAQVAKNVVSTTAVPAGIAGYFPIAAPPRHFARVTNKAASAGVG